jgi:hypothetical protein
MQVAALHAKGGSWPQQGGSGADRLGGASAARDGDGGGAPWAAMTRRVPRRETNTWRARPRVGAARCCSRSPRAAPPAGRRPRCGGAVDAAHRISCVLCSGVQAQPQLSSSRTRAARKHACLPLPCPAPAPHRAPDAASERTRYAAARSRCRCRCASSPHPSGCFARRP